MIKTIQLLKDSFTTYKLNFKKILIMTLPIVLLTIVAQYYAFDLNQKMQSGQFNFLYIIFAGLLYFISILVVGLFLTPAISRSIQKNEDNGIFDVREGYNFQKKNIWKFIMVNVWGFLYILKRLLPYIITSVLLALIISFFNLSKTIDYVFMVIIVSFVVVGIILNISRFILYKNIFFSKDNITAKGAVKESMNLGITKTKDVWKIILAMIILAIVMEVIIALFNMLSITGIYNLILGSVIMIIFSTPYMLIIASKGYVKVRSDDVALPMEEMVDRV